jgi:hypothetical protein
VASVQEGRLVAAGHLDAGGATYKDVDVLSELLPYWNKINNTIYDLAHEFANVVKQALNYIKNKGKNNKAKFSKNSRIFEQHRMRRFPTIGQRERQPGGAARRKGKKRKAPWIATSKSQAGVNSLPKHPGTNISTRTY